MVNQYGSNQDSDQCFKVSRYVHDLTAKNLLCNFLASLLMSIDNFSNNIRKLRGGNSRARLFVFAVCALQQSLNHILSKCIFSLSHYMITVYTV